MVLLRFMKDYLLGHWLYTYGRPNYKITLYLKEDLLVNNAPDAQTGISIQIPISK